MSKKIDDLQEPQMPQEPQEPHELDKWLSSGFLSPPAEFTDQVMRRIQTLPAPERKPQAKTLPAPERKPQAKTTLHDIVKWLLLLGGAALGTAELLMFIFGIWITTAAA